jgi:DnaK suppressor protein
MGKKGKKHKKSERAKKSGKGKAARRLKLAAKRRTPRKKTAGRPAAARKPEKAKPAPRPPVSRVFREPMERPREPRDLSAPIGGFTPYVQKRGEQYMNPAQAQHFRNILLDWKRSLMEEVDRTVHHMQDEASNFPDPNDRATQEEEFALELRTRDRERKLIKKIDEALLGLDTGDYGYCEICGVEIGIKRLEARPTATLCIDCKTLDEIKEKQLG